MLFAGHDMTASSLAMIFWLLAEHPDWRTEMRDEVETLYHKSGSAQLAYEDLASFRKSIGSSKKR